MAQFKTYSARLVRSSLLSEFTKHLEFEVLEVARFGFVPGQWLSVKAHTPDGEEITRAYSIASPPSANGHVAFCLNRVQDGFMSNHLCDLAEGSEITFQGPFGDFILRPPLRDTLFIATGTGIAPFRSMLHGLFESGIGSSRIGSSGDRVIGSSDAGLSGVQTSRSGVQLAQSHDDRMTHSDVQITRSPDGPITRSDGPMARSPEFWLLFGARYERDIYYRDEFARLAAEHANFHFLPTLSRSSPEWRGLRGYVQEHVQSIVGDRKDMLAYICGLDKMIQANRQLLKSLGWERTSIRYEKYD
jgi:ferredoxin-NADP reductase